MSDRGIKKWNAYKALPEHEETIKKFIKEKNKISKPELSEEEIENINSYMLSYHGQECEITIFKNGELQTISSIIKKIDPMYKKIILPTRKTIIFDDIVSLKDKDN